MNRILIVSAFIAFVFAGFVPAFAARADGAVRIVQAHGSPYLSDFTTLSGKRADLRLSVAREGLDAAFADWLRTAHADAFRQAATRTVTHRQSSVRLASASCCVHDDGKCCASCPVCCAKDHCTMNCCDMRVCSQQRMICCR